MFIYIFGGGGGGNERMSCFCINFTSMPFLSNNSLKSLKNETPLTSTALTAEREVKFRKEIKFLSAQCMFVVSHGGCYDKEESTSTLKKQHTHQTNQVSHI